MQRLCEVRVQGCALPDHSSLLGPQQHPLKPLNCQEMGRLCSQKEKHCTNISAAQIQCTGSRRITALQKVLLAAEEVTDVQLGRQEMEHSVVTVRLWHQLLNSSPSTTVLGGDRTSRTAAPDPWWSFQAFIPTLGDSQALLTSLGTRQGFPKEIKGLEGINSVLTPVLLLQSSPKPQGCCSGLRHSSE